MGEVLERKGQLDRLIEVHSDPSESWDWPAGTVASPDQLRAVTARKASGA